MARPRRFPALEHRDFRLVWIGLAISGTGTMVQRVAVAWQVYELTLAGAVGAPWSAASGGIACAVVAVAVVVLAPIVRDHRAG